MSIPGRVPVTIFGAVLQMAQLRPVFTADFYAVDGVSGKVASFIDWNDATHTLAQAISGNQVALPAAHADYGGKFCVTFTGAEQYVSNRSVAYWGTFHSDSGSVTTIATPTATGVRVYWETTDNFALPYLLCYQNSTGPHFRAEFRATAGSSVVTASVGTLATGTPVAVRVRWNSTTIASRVAGVEATGVIAAAPTGSPARGFALSRISAPLIGRLAAVIMSPYVATDMDGVVQQLWKVAP